MILLLYDCRTRLRSATCAPPDLNFLGRKNFFSHRFLLSHGSDGLLLTFFFLIFCILSFIDVSFSSTASRFLSLERAFSRLSFVQFRSPLPLQFLFPLSFLLLFGFDLLHSSNLSTILLFFSTFLHSYLVFFF